MLLGSSARERLEPVSVVRSTFLYGPFLHLMSDDISSLEIEVTTTADDLLQLLIYLLRKPLLHRPVIEDILSEDLSNVYLIFFFHFSFLAQDKRTVPMSF